MERTVSVSNRLSTSSLLTLVSVGSVVALALFCSRVEPKTHALVQAFAFPLVVLLVSRMTIAGIAVPQWALGFALVGAVSGALFTYTHIELARGAFVVAPIEGDTSDSDTKIRRDHIRRALGTAGLALVGTHRSEVSSSQEAEGVLQSNRMLGGVVWGSTRWLNVSLRAHEPFDISSLPAESFGHRYLRDRGYPNLELAVGIRSIGISDSLDETTLLFLGRIVPLWRDFPSQLSGHREDGDFFEQKARSVAALKSRWTSFSHRALPMWMTGTYHLVQAISSEQLGRGELSCAVSSFEAALSQLRPTDNPELQIAVRNNLAIALLMQADGDSASDEAQERAVKLLKGARFFQRSSQQDLAVTSVLKFNLSTLKGDYGKRRRRKEQSQ